jgi:hypothetical protein
MNEAVLKSADGSVEVRISIFPSSDEAWVNYTLQVYDAQQVGNNGLIADLSLLKKETNFLQCFPENEIEMLADEIMRVLNSEDECLSFSPIDDKDFILELSNSDKSHIKIVSLFVSEAAGYVYRGIRFKVDITTLAAFREQLVQSA